MDAFFVCVYVTHSAVAVFEQALAVNDPKAIYFQLLSIFERATNWQLVESTLRTMIRKFKDSQKVWLRYIQSKVLQQKMDEARAVLSRSFQSLPKSKRTQLLLLLLMLLMLLAKQQNYQW